MALPTDAITPPSIALAATACDRRHDAMSTGRLIDPSQATLNWQPPIAVRWNTTPQMVFGNALWRTRFRTT